MDSLLSVMEGDAVLSHLRCSFLDFDFVFYITEGLHWDRRLACGWAVPNINGSYERFRGGGLVLNNLKTKGKGKLFGTWWLSFPVPAPPLGSVTLWRAVLGWPGTNGLKLQHKQVHRTAALWWEGLLLHLGNKGPTLERSQGPDASLDSELGISSTACICSASFVYV